MLSKIKAVIQAFKRRHRIGEFRAFKVPDLATQKAIMFARAYPAGAIDRLTADWFPSTSTGDAEIRFDICSLRDRSRQLERADPLMRRFLSVLEKNVLKSGVGFSFQNKAKNPNGTPDFLANQKVEMAWNEWCKPKNCSENGEESFYDTCRLALRSAARDGGILIRKIMGAENDFRFALRMVEIDHLDINYNVSLGNGNRVVMGVEKDGIGRTVAYWILDKHPGDMLFGASPHSRRRFPASEFIHYFVKERVTQCVGVPWAAPSMIRMHHLEQYQIAELVAAREAANKGGYFTSTTGQPYAGENEQAVGADGVLADTGATLAQSQPGQHDELPPGMSFVPYDPTHPTQQFGDFVRDCNLGIAAGFDVSYATLVGDLTRSSFSSMRTGWLDERESYKKMQAHMIEHFALQVFESWLAVQLTTGLKVNLPMSKMSQFNQPNFRGRRWPWVDPEKDIKAKLMEKEALVTTLDAIIDESDSEMDLEETLAQLGYEQKLQKKHGLTYVGVGGGQSQPAKEPSPEPEEVIEDVEPEEK